MTNPNDIIRTRARTGGRASVYEANAWAQMLTSGLLDGSGVTQNTSADMNVIVGGSSTSPDVLIAENPSGYKIALDVVGQQTVAISAPTSNSRVSAIVAYTDDLALSTDQDDVTGAPASCGLIVVNGTSAASPVDPDDETIRAAITADGATGSQASYVIIATVKVTSSTTAITDSLITINKAGVPARNIDFAPSEVYPALSGANQQIAAVITNGGKVVHLTGLATLNTASATFTLASDVPKPARSIYVPVTAGLVSGATNISGYAIISASGNVTFNMSGATTYGMLSCTYLAAS